MSEGRLRRAAGVRSLALPPRLLAIAALALCPACSDDAKSRGAAEVVTAARAVVAAEPVPIAAAPEPPARRFEPPPAGQLEEYAARRAKTVLELQPFRQTTMIAIQDGAGHFGEATLTELDPGLGDWLLLRVDFGGNPGGGLFHLENPSPERQGVRLAAAGLEITTPEGVRSCELWTGNGADVLGAARATRQPYAPLCGGRLTLRNRVEGRKTTLEWATDLLRDRVWKGEQVTVFVREKLYKDAFLETSELGAGAAPEAIARPRPAGAPLRPLVDPRFDGRLLTPANLGLELDSDHPERMLVGRWHRVRGVPDVFVSAIEPRLIAPEVLDALRGRLNPLDEVESSALVYLVAFDLDAFEVGFALGTDHPRVGWSERAPAQVRDAGLPGPDGIDSLAPLVMTGMVAPAAAGRVAATFTGGFKRSHGAFRAGDFAHRNFASHYGFVEHGAILSKLQPGLATVVVWNDGRVDLETWDEALDGELGRVRYARQNGVPLLEPDRDSGRVRPGRLVAQWTTGNWSGSVDKRLRSLRAGVCLQESDAGRFLIYGYFSSVTPSAMAQVFQAYQCRYAMLTDMNALEHTYLALYRVRGGSFLTQHLIDGMSVLDKSEGGQELPRFVGFPDNRDFFYLLRKE